MAGINNNFLGANFLKTAGETKITKTPDNLQEPETSVENGSSGAQANVPAPTEQSQAALENYNNYLGMLGKVEVNVPSQSEAAGAAEGTGHEEVNTTTDPDGGSTTTTTVYDAAGRIIKETVVKKDKDGNVTGSKLISYKYADDKTTPYQIQTDTFDANGKLQIQAFDHYRADGTKYASNYIKYDESGHKTEESYSQFDELERLTEESSVKYDSNGNIISRTHATYEYDGENKTPANTTAYEYDSNGNVLQSVTTTTGKDGVAGKVVTTYERETITDENGNVTGSKLTSSKYANDSETPYQVQVDTFDASGKLQTQAFEHYRADGTKYASNYIKYDENGRKTEESYSQYDESGKLTEHVEVKYDKDGKVISRTQTSYKDGGAEVDQVSTTTYEYDSNGKLTGSTETTTDAEGNVTGTTTTTVVPLRSGDRVTEIIRDKDGNLKAENIYTYVGGLVKDYHHIEYDENEQVIKDLTTRYEYDEKGRITRSEEIEKDADENVISRNITTYEYSDKDTKDDIPSVVKTEIRGAKDEPIETVTTNYRPDGTAASDITEKYENGNLKEVMERKFDENGKISEGEKTEYNDKGEPIKVTKVYYYRDENGKLTQKTTVTQDLVAGTTKTEKQFFNEISIGIQPGQPKDEIHSFEAVKFEPAGLYPNTLLSASRLDNPPEYANRPLKLERF